MPLGIPCRLTDPLAIDEFVGEGFSGISKGHSHSGSFNRDSSNISRDKVALKLGINVWKLFVQGVTTGELSEVCYSVGKVL